jgi:hypothetical protein
MSATLRLAGLAIPIVSVLVLSNALDRPNDGPRGATNLAFLTILILAAFFGSILLRSCSSVIVIPLAMGFTAQVHQTVICRECHGPTYDIGLGGAILSAVVLFVPLCVASIIGTAIGFAWNDRQRT